MIRVDIPAEVLTVLEYTAQQFDTECQLRPVRNRFDHPMSHNHYETTLLGLLGETALKLHLGLPWHPKLDRDYDVDGYIEVRTTRRANPTLIIREGDKKAPYVLARAVTNRIVHLLGWLDRDDARHPKFHPDWLEANRYSVPPKHLHSMDTLPRKVTQ